MIQKSGVMLVEDDKMGLVEKSHYSRMGKEKMPQTKASVINLTPPMIRRPAAVVLNSHDLSRGILIVEGEIILIIRFIYLNWKTNEQDIKIFLLANVYE